MNSNILRFLIREMLLHEAPLDHIGGYRDPNDPGTDPDDLNAELPRPSIAFDMSTSLYFQEHAKVLMKDTTNNWSIITLWDVRDASKIIESIAFEEWFLKQKIPATSRVIVVAGEPFEYDYTTPEWTIVHDIIGHSIARSMSKTVAFDRQEAHGRVQGYYDWRDVAENVHEVLPKVLQLGGPGDKLPDICGAIFTKPSLREDLVLKVQKYIAVKTGWNPKNPEENEKIRNEASHITGSLFEDIDKWGNGFIPGVPTLVEQF